ncbi:NAD(P)H-dependent oxidoreductase [Streptomyces sp. SL13]|uniref:NAD(P)H-dependent oxidoreductase n=1 Tax=Streptantibioticus silvisoli TaxID=2705255 RepID=A0AA90KF67_9ACTN|nr:NAD(P)H-dependent oxidoreductase [Streptantibioticus silvisoli]MDI5968865.1 NAD(P)H-dependent oxidoreductase [Streptantibioticus silvisoli]
MCRLHPSPTASSRQLRAEQVLTAPGQEGVEGEAVRIVDHDVRPGVGLDRGDGDDRPALRERVLAADILVIATPIWFGHASSVAQRVLERLDAVLSESDDEGRLLTYGKVAVVAVVGNEDGAHKVSADLFQALDDVGFSLAPGAVTYWVGETQHGTGFQDLQETPDTVVSSTRTLAANTAHLARLLRERPCPPG